MDFSAEAAIKQSCAHRLKIVEAAILHCTLAVVVNNQRALLSLKQFMAANLDKRFNNKIEGVDVIVKQYEFLLFSSLDIFQDQFFLFGMR